MRKQIGRREQKINECFPPRRIGADTAPGDCYSAHTHILIRAQKLKRMVGQPVWNTLFYCDLSKRIEEFHS